MYTNTYSSVINLTIYTMLHNPLDSWTTYSKGSTYLGKGDLIGFHEYAKERKYIIQLLCLLECKLDIRYVA